MALEEALVARVKTAAGVEAMIDEPNRITYFERVRGAGLPAISILTVSITDGWTHDGANGFDWVRVRFDIWAAKRTDAVELGRLIRADMQVAKEISGVRFQRAERLAQRNIDEGEQEGGGELFRLQQEYGFYYEEL
jgi:hypothetical protein